MIKFNTISKRRLGPPSLSVLAAEWKSRYAAGPDKHHREVIKTEPEGISFISDSMHGLVPYSGQGKVYRKDQIVGQWNHPTDRSMAEGFFMLTVSPIADVTYGYSTSQDENGAILYGMEHGPLRRRTAAPNKMSTPTFSEHKRR